MRELDMDGLARALKQGSKDLNKTLRTELRAAGEVVATGARALASTHSDHIADTIRVSTSGYTVRITAHGALAKMYEVGNEGRTSPTFSHPVFARGDKSTWTWVHGQKRYPFLLPTFLAGRDRVLAQMTKAIHDAFPGNT